MIINPTFKHHSHHHDLPHFPTRRSSDLREYGFINARLRKNNKIIVGHWSSPTFHKEVSEWMVSAVGYIESQNIKVARFGDNMRNVAVTEGDKVKAAIQFGWTVDYFGFGDLVE